MDNTLKVDQRVANILWTATKLYSDIESYLEDEGFRKDEFPGETLDGILGDLGLIFSDLGNIAGRSLISKVCEDANLKIFEDYRKKETNKLEVK